MRGPYLTKSRATEEEVRPEGWQAAEARARDAARTGGRPVGLGGFISGKAPRALPGMVPNSRLTASPPPTFGTGGERKEQEAATGPSVSAMAKSWGKPVEGGPSRASTVPVQAMTLEERLRLDDEAKAAGGRATAPPTETV